MAWIVGPYGRTIAYCLRTMLAIGIALYVSFALQLLSPMSSVTTVLIVANPVTGALVSKSLWRLCGTVLGAAMAVALIAAFAQTPLLFTGCLALCIGAACTISSLMRYFRAYAAVLAGYTIILVAAGSFQDPQNIFIGALSRVSAVSVGVASAALVFLLTAPPKPSRLDPVIEALLRDVATAFLRRRQMPPDPDPPARASLLARTLALDEAIEYAAADDSAVRRRGPRLRQGVSRILSMVSLLEPLHDRLAGDDEAGEQARRIAHAAMRELAVMPQGGLAGTLSAIEAARGRAQQLADTAQHPRVLTLARHEADLLALASGAVSDLTGAAGGARPMRLPPFLDWSTALRNGLRGAMVTLIGGVFWYATQWTAGPTMLSFLIPGACLLSTAPSASQASVRFATGALLALPMAAFCQIVILPQISGFPLLWGSLCVCLAPGIWLQFNPRHGLRAFGFVVFFGAMISVRNPIRFDDLALLNTWEAFVLGSACLVMVFRVLLPANPERDARRLASGLARAVERLAGGRAILTGPAWEHRQMQAVLRLSQRMQQIPGADPSLLLDAGFALVALGRAAMRLRAARGDRSLGEAERQAAASGLSALRRLRAAPASAAASLDRLASRPDSTDTARRMDGLLGEAALLTARVQDLVARDAPILDRAIPHRALRLSPAGA